MGPRRRLDGVDRFVGRWLQRGYALLAILIGAAILVPGYRILMGDGDPAGLILLIPGAAALAVGLRLFWTSGRRRLTDLDA